MANERNRASSAEAVRRAWLLALLVVAAVVGTEGTGWPAARDWRGQSVGESKTGRPATLIALGFGLPQVWQPSPTAVADLQNCTVPISLNCVHAVMEQHGASADAFEFYHLTGWFLLALKDTGGPVMLASVANPWRANENEQPALLGGLPVVVYPEDVGVPVESEADFKALKADFPQLVFWNSGPTLEANTVTTAGESFVFRYRLLDGCRVCAIRGWARVEFDFATDGTYQRAKFLNVVRS